MYNKNGVLYRGKTRIRSGLNAGSLLGIAYPVFHNCSYVWNESLNNTRFTIVIY